MKLPVRIGTLVALCVGVCRVACAQDLGTSLEWTNQLDIGAWPGGSAPALNGAAPLLGNPRIAPAGMPAANTPLVIPVQNPATLGTANEFGSVPRAHAGGEGLAGWMPPTWPGQMTVAMAMVAAGVEKSPTASKPDTDALDADSKCFSLALRVGQRVKDDPSSLLEVAAKEVAANPTCACEVVKAALTAAKPNPDTVARVVEATALASPESLRLVAQCAIAVEPAALAKVQAVLARLDPNGGKSKHQGGDKDAKESAEKASLETPPNPLDLPPREKPVIPTPVSNPGGWQYR